MNEHMDVEWTQTETTEDSGSRDEELLRLELKQNGSTTPLAFNSPRYAYVNDDSNKQIFQ